MRIVSQDGTMSFNFDNIVLWTQNNIIYAKVGIESKVLGCYELEERAAEVFEDIHKQYCGLNGAVFQNIDIPDDFLAEMKKNPKPIIVQTQDENQKVEILPTVYYMPAE